MTRILQTLVGDLKSQKYLTIILNSSLHLQNVIEDALDMSRIENNQFEIISEFFNVRSAVEEVSSIMSFQVTQK
jgi:signal transduction histidine kinase